MQKNTINMFSIDKTNDSEVILAIKKGGISSQKYIKYLYEEAFSRMIFKLKRKFPFSEVEIKDCYTDSILKLICQIKLDKFKGKSRLSSYFYRIFYNTCVDYVRKKSAAKEESLLADDSVFLPDPSQNILEILEVSDELRTIKSYLNELDENCRLVLIYHAQGYSMEEIAQKIGLKNKDSATTKKYKCFNRLKQLIKEDQAFIDRKI